MAFWDTVEMLRSEQNTSYRWLAQKMGISEQTVSTMRKAGTEPRATEAVKIAKALNTTVEYLTEGITSNQEYFNKYTALKEHLKTLIETL